MHGSEEQDLKGEMGECQGLDAKVPLLSWDYFCLLGQGAGQGEMGSPPVLFSCSFESTPDEAGGRKRESEDVRGAAGGDLGDPGF